MKQVIRLEHVTKRKKNETMVEELNLSINTGEVVGFVGTTYEKTTLLMQMLAGEITPCTGKIFYDKEDLGKYGQVPGQVGVYVSDIGFLEEYSGYRNLKYIAGMNGKVGETEIKDAIQFVGLSPTNRKKVLHYTKRMRQKLSIAQAIMEGQKVLLLDAGIFTEGNKENHAEIRKILMRLKKLGNTICIASEKQEYIERICDQIIYL
ncbi:ATP-binding cassette domain-containing protein [Anaerosporobacter faecicola]|uniref:ATP-binding cassette domain-containing protein n=1 Tax=Anaerosporobacter faecicola TaxID=2718714 RepID=UPI001439F920|nr:ATP-binding cassette domain-containing protein [Anaerosporobacter faecicola]